MVESDVRQTTRKRGSTLPRINGPGCSRCDGAGDSFLAHFRLFSTNQVWTTPPTLLLELPVSVLWWRAETQTALLNVTVCSRGVHSHRISQDAVGGQRAHSISFCMLTVLNPPDPDAAGLHRGSRLKLRPDCERLCSGSDVCCLWLQKLGWATFCSFTHSYSSEMQDGPLIVKVGGDREREGGLWLWALLQLEIRAQIDTARVHQRPPPH